MSTYYSYIKEQVAQTAKLKTHFPNSFSILLLFLDASSYLYKRVCPSVGPSIRPSVRHPLFKYNVIPLTKHPTSFLDASSHLYKRVCPSVGPSVRPSVPHYLNTTLFHSQTTPHHFQMRPRISIKGYVRRSVAHWGMDCAQRPIRPKLKYQQISCNFQTCSLDTCYTYFNRFFDHILFFLPVVIAESHLL